MRIKVLNWLQKYKKYFFSYRDGFFELPFIANSPELMVDSFSNMPFMKNFPKQGFFQTNNPFIKGEGHYQKLEEGLWIIMSNIEIKRDLTFKLSYLQGETSEYHFLTLYINRGSKTVKLPKLQLNIDNLDRTWTLFKAGSNCYNTHFKGQKSIFFSLYFSREWLKNNIASNGSFTNSSLQHFFSSNNEYIFLPNLLDNKKELYENIIYSILDKNENGVKDLLLLKSQTYEIIASFVANLEQLPKVSEERMLTERDRRKVFYAQHLIDAALFDKFPSIKTIAKLTGVSETKIKNDFKTLMGTSMLQYFIQQQMNYAIEMLKNNECSIKEVSNSLGYSSPSKFTEAFKKYYGTVPSQLMQFAPREQLV